MKWREFTRGDVLALANDDDGNSWCIVFDGCAEVDSANAGDCVVLKRNEDIVASVKVANEEEPEFLRYEMDAAVRQIVKSLKIVANTLVFKKPPVEVNINRSFSPKRIARFSGRTADGYVFVGHADRKPTEVGIPTPEFPNGSRVSKLFVESPKGQRVFDYDKAFFNAACIDADLDAVTEIMAAVETALPEGV